MTNAAYFVSASASKLRPLTRKTSAYARHLINRSRKSNGEEERTFQEWPASAFPDVKALAEAHIAYNSHLTDDLRQEYCLWPTQSYFLMRGVSPEQQLNERTITAMFQLYCCTASASCVLFAHLCGVRALATCTMSILRRWCVWLACCLVKSEMSINLMSTRKSYTTRKIILLIAAVWQFYEPIKSNNFVFCAERPHSNTSGFFWWF